MRLETRLERRQARTGAACEPRHAASGATSSEYRTLLDGGRRGPAAGVADGPRSRAALAGVAAGRRASTSAAGARRSGWRCSARQPPRPTRACGWSRPQAQGHHARRADFDEPPDVVGHIELPAPFAPNNHAFQHQVAEQLQRARVSGREPAPARGAAAREAVARPRPRPRRTRWPAAPTATSTCGPLVQAERVAPRGGRPRAAVQGPHRVAGPPLRPRARVLEAWGYLDGWALTERGEVLGRIYHECDLLVAEAWRPGLFDDLDPASLAGLRVVLHLRAPQRRPRRRRRGSRRPRPRALRGASRRWRRELNADEQEAGLPFTRLPDPASARSPTRGRRARASTTCSRTRSCRAATSSATSGS